VQICAKQVPFGSLMLSVQITTEAPFPGFIGSSDVMRVLFRHIRKIAGSSATVLLLGETGTGKELVARAIHELSPRESGPFIRVNCGALSDSLLESELFGHVKGAFTNAIENRTGRFEAGHGGTIFLDEINSISPTLQVKLLRVLQEHQFERVGDTRTISVDCRIIAATNRDLTEMVKQQTFREDLYYRLNVLPIDVPPLRERREDIPELVQYFISRYAAQNHRPELKVSPETFACFQAYQWPGNVRELQNYIERAIVLADTDVLSTDLLPPHVRGEPPIRRGRTDPSELESLCTELVARCLKEVAKDDFCHAAVMGRVERELILQILRSCQGTQTRTATRLGINRNTLHKKIEDFKLQDEVR